MFASQNSSPGSTAILTARGHGSVPLPIRAVKKWTELFPMVMVFVALTRIIVSEVHWLFCF